MPPFLCGRSRHNSTAQACGPELQHEPRGAALEHPRGQSFSAKARIRHASLPRRILSGRRCPHTTIPAPMFGLFERYLQPTAVPAHPEPPAGLVGFLWHFARQAKWLFIALFVVEFFV